MKIQMENNINLNQIQLLLMYEIEQIKADLCSGLFNSVIFAGCFGVTCVAIAAYKDGIHINQYLKEVAKRTGKSMFLFAPFLCSTRILDSYLTQKKYETRTIIAANVFVMIFLLKVLPKNIV